MDIFHFIPGYTTSIYDAGREPALVVLLSFLVTFIFTRAYTRMARVRTWKSGRINGVHTHHLVFGLMLAFVAGALQFAFLPQQGFFQLALAAAFGCGAALVLDEFALIFHLEDVYWEEKGRKSVDAVVIGSIFGLIFLLQAVPFGAASSLPRVGLTVTILINLAFVLMTAMKGKIFMAIFGVFIPALAMIGAIRLAEPDSVWAREFYDSRPNKLKRSIQRYRHYERTWKPRKEHLWDIFGGKIGHHG
jgi:hypothetical protein